MADINLENILHQGYNITAANVYQDNTSTIALAEKGRSTSERTRHVHVRYFFVRDRIQAGEIKISYLPTAEMVADLLTKPLQGELFRKLRNKLLNCLSHVRGGETNRSIDLPRTAGVC